MKDLHTGAVARNEIPIARLQYLTSRIHKLGARPLFELLCELDSGADLSSVLERYVRLEPLTDFISHFGGDQLLPPARLVGGRR
jgi:hypothetical protein